MNWSFLECILFYNSNDTLFLQKFKLINKSSLNLYNLYKRNIIVNGNLLQKYFYHLGIDYDIVKSDFDIINQKFHWNTLSYYFNLFYLQLDWYLLKKFKILNNSLLSKEEQIRVKYNDPFHPTYAVHKLRKRFKDLPLTVFQRYLLRTLNRCKRDNKYLYSIIF